MGVLEDAESYLAALGAKTDAFADKVRNISFDTVSGSLHKFFEAFKHDVEVANVNLSTTQTAFDKLSNSFAAAFNLVDRFQGFSKLSANSGAAINTMVGQFDILTSRLGGFKEFTAKIGGDLGRQFAEAGPAATRAFLERAEQAEKLESAYLDLRAASGQLDTVWKNAGQNLEFLDGMVADFGQRLVTAAQATGHSTSEVSQYVSSLGQIPGVLDQTIRGGKGATDRIDALTATLKLASGAHRSVQEAIDAMNLAYTDLGNAQGPVTDNADKGARLFAMMAETSQKLNLRFDDTKGYLTSIADLFKHVGDNTQGAANILARFSGSLQQTGLTAGASVDIIKNMVNAMSNLEVGTKALISMRAGGSGGLQGVFQVEQLLRQGKVDEVAKMMERSLRQQFGGRIYTQAEAARDPRAAAEFMRQRMILQSGAFGGLAKSDADATRLLEAMSKGPTVTANTIKGSMEAVGDTIERGTDITNRQLTVLNDINTTLDRSAATQDQHLMLFARSLGGATVRGPAGTPIARPIQQEALRVQQDTAARLQKSGRDVKFEDAENPDYNYIGTLATRQATAGLKRTLTSTRQFANVAQTIARGAVAGVSETLGDLEQESKRTIAETKAQQGMQATRRAVVRGTSMKQEMQEAITGAAMPTLRGQLPAPNVTKHEISKIPVEVTVKAPEGFSVGVQSRNPQVTVTSTNITQQLGARMKSGGAPIGNKDPGY